MDFLAKRRRHGAANAPTIGGAIGGADVAAHRRTPRKTVPAAQAFSETDS